MAKKKGKSNVYKRHPRRKPSSTLQSPAKTSSTTNTSSAINTSSVTNTKNDDVITAALTSIPPPVHLKLCRLCEGKDGPFLNIFDPDTLTAKKIQDLMPFSILENDDLPHKICFRCSAKVEELHEFVQKCIRTQESLKATLGKNKSTAKTKMRTQWEEQLNKSNISNDDICNALIKKAMEGIKDMPIHTFPAKEVKTLCNKLTPPPTKSSDSPLLEIKDVPSDLKSDQSNESDKVSKKVKTSAEKCDSKPLGTRKLRSKNVDNNIITDVALDNNACGDINKIIEKTEDKVDSKVTKTKLKGSDEETAQNVSTENSLPQKEVKSGDNTKPFNIMDHVTTIKVNGVGVLFQCTLCNRNFLKKEVLESHGCAKNGPAKTQLPKPLPPPEPPKVMSSVKYIDSKKVGQVNSDLSKLESNINKDSSIRGNKNGDATSKTEIKLKPKIGPASKVKRNAIQPPLNEGKSIAKLNVQPHQETSSETSSLNSDTPIVNIPTVPSLNSRYKLVPGPNNSLTLIEETKIIKKDGESTTKSNDLKKKISLNESNKIKGITPPEVVIDLDNDMPSSSKEQPYPVGLFQTMLNRSNMEVPPATPDASKLATTTKKQSYTVVQTGDPSKLVISTRQAIAEDIPKKRMKKNKTDAGDGIAKEPFSVTLEDVAPPKDSGFFTFINVDPLLQPSYVLPTDNIIQESQISTSTPAVINKPEGKEKNKYTCGMCSESFSREKKLLAHLQSHYAKLDEDEVAETNQNKKRRRKS